MIALLITIFMFIGLAIGLAWYMITHDRGAKEPIGVLWAALGFGAAGAVVAMVLEEVLIPKQLLIGGTSVSGGLFAGTLTVGIIEEACKALPLALYLYKKPFFSEHTDGVIYFAIAGLGFGVPENLLYSIGFGTSTGITRLVLVPFFHAATTSIVGFYLAKYKFEKRNFWHILWPLAALSVIHGVYDFGLSSGIGVFVLLSLCITFSLTVSIFVFYAKAGKLDRQAGLSIIGTNSFCRTCGTPNPKHYLYCQRCGQRA